MEEPKTKNYREYHKGTHTQVKREGGVMCLNPSCVSGTGGCEHCGWNTVEAERRKKIPLEEYIHEVKDKDGNVVSREKRRRKFLGLRNSTGEADSQ